MGNVIHATQVYLLSEYGERYPVLIDIDDPFIDTVKIHVEYGDESMTVVRKDASDKPVSYEIKPITGRSLPSGHGYTYTIKKNGSWVVDRERWMRRKCWSQNDWYIPAHRKGVCS